MAIIQHDRVAHSVQFKRSNCLWCRLKIDCNCNKSINDRERKSRSNGSELGQRTIEKKCFWHFAEMLICIWIIVVVVGVGRFRARTWLQRLHCNRQSIWRAAQICSCLLLLTVKMIMDCHSYWVCRLLQGLATWPRRSLQNRFQCAINRRSFLFLLKA